MKHSVCIETIFTELPFYERFKAVAESGFNYVEFWTWEDKDLKRIKQLCHEFKLGVASFSGDKEFSLVDLSEKGKYIEFLLKSIDAAKLLGSGNLVIHSNALGDGGRVVNHYTNIPKNERISNMQETLKEISKLAETSKSGMILKK